MKLDHIFRVSVACFIAVLLSAILSFANLAAASDRRSLVESVVVQGGLGRLELKFKEPIAESMADDVRKSLSEPSSVNESAVPPERWKLKCNTDVTFVDGNGTFDVAYRCKGKWRSMPWGYKLSKSVRSIVVGNINEQGLSWWRNGKRQPRNAPHTVPPDYRLHGTMKPVSKSNNIECQDYITFRHNIGPGGTGSVTFAAALKLVN